MFNLLTDPLLETGPGGPTTLPGVLARLVWDEVESFPALRPHQAPAWHMFLVQLAALALQRSECMAPPDTEEGWLLLLSGLTPEFPAGEPWHLVVDDWSRPAFLQPPGPDGTKIENPLPTPDALDVPITARNHDLKASVARHAEPQDWVFALVSLQTGEGYGGAGNQGIARMNGGSSSRFMLGLAPLPSGGKRMAPRLGPWFVRDLRVLLQTRAEVLQSHSHLEYQAEGGIGLTWTVPWPEGAQLQTRQLDIWFIEVCRRVRLQHRDERLSGKRGTSKATRIHAKHLSGAVGDPWAPVHKTEGKSFTLGEGNLGYRTLSRLLLGDKNSQDWLLPVLARPASGERNETAMAVVAAAIARGNSKTEGFHTRTLPIGGRQAHALGVARKRQELFELAQEQLAEIATFDRAFREGLVMTAAGGDRGQVREVHYRHTRGARMRFDTAVDPLFFEHLWRRHDALEAGAAALASTRLEFRQALLASARTIFEAALPAMPCQSLFRPRAEARARSAFFGILRKAFPDLFA